MAKTSKKTLKEAPYVASNLDINYTIPVGLTAMLSRATKTSDKDVWVKLSEMANICAARILQRLANKTGSHSTSVSSWTTQVFPGSNVTLRMDMDGYKEFGRWDWQTKQQIQYDVPKQHFSCRIKISGTSTEVFKQSQVDTYIMDKMETYLFGDDKQIEELEELEERFNIPSSEENE